MGLKLIVVCILAVFMTIPSMFVSELVSDRTHRATEVLKEISSHVGGPLDEGEVRDGCIVCPWHGSTFRLDDGGVVHGPAASPQPAFDTRVQDGKVQVKART